MARFLTGLFGSSQQTQPPATSLRINTSLQGVPIGLLLGGRNRLAGNLIDYYDLRYLPASSSGGGKGGVFSAGSGKGNTGQYNYFVNFLIGVCEGPVSGYSAMWINGNSVPIPPPDTVGTLDGYGTNSTYAAELMLGDYAQGPWSFTEAADPSHALAYRGIATANFAQFPLGSSTTLPNFTFEVQAGNGNINAIPGQPDGLASLAAIDFLTNPHYGLGFPAFRLDTLAQWASYNTALGMVVSPVVAAAIKSSSLLGDLATATNVAWCWQDGILTAVPYGDTAVTAGQVSSITETHEVPKGSVVAVGNQTFEYPSIVVGNVGTFAGDGGVSFASGEPLTKVADYAPTGLPGTGSPGEGQYYENGGTYYFNAADIAATVLITYDFAAAASFIPNNTPLYDFTIDDCLPNQATIGSGVSIGNSPFLIVRQSRDQMLNDVKVEYLDRTNSYNPVDIEVKDEASITAFGRLRPSDVKQFHFFCLASAAQQSAVLQLVRAQVARTFQWTVGRHFMLILELMAIVTVTDPGQGLDRQAVRVTEIAENDDFSLTITAEEFLGTVSAPTYGVQASSGAAPNYNADPGAVNAPIIFEPTDELNQTNALGSLQIWGAVSGENTALWGGCYVWASYDNETFSIVGIINGASRMGVTTADLPAVTPSPIGPPTIDTVDTLSVNLSESAGALAAATQADALALNTRCYVGGEVVSYATAALTAASEYDLSYLIRGAYGTEAAIVDHPAGTPFARLDTNIFSFAYDQSRIGATLYLKFQSFNIFQGGLQNLADCAVYTYAITGAALASPLPSVTNLRTIFDVNSGFMELVWDSITDFRNFTYEVRSGSSPASAMTLSADAQSPFRVPGDGTYWVAAVASPAPGLTVYSEAWEDVTISGAVITQNVIKTVDLKALGWPGVFSGGAGLDSVLNAIRTGGGNILSDTSILTTSDILDFGGGQAGLYVPDDNAFLDIGYVTTASVVIEYQPTGIPVGQNVLAIGDFLDTQDVLGAASTAFINVYPQIDTATTAGGDLYSVGDLYQYPDLYSIGDINWNGFQKFAPGTYQTRFLYFSMVLDTGDPQTIAENLAFKITITIPARIDSYALTTSASANTTVTFAPNGASSPAPFNGGPGPGSLPSITWGIVNAQAGDDLVITALSLSAVTFEIVNGGSRVVRNLTLFAEGF